MTIAELRLYSYGIDRTRGDVPIFATAAAEAAAGGGTGVTAPSLTFSSVKVRRDPYPQTVEVSIDASNMDTLELCDTAVMKIGSVDRWYFITGYEEVTNSAYPNSSVNRMNVRISLDYIPVTTGLTLASKVDILPERLPAATPRMVQNWTESYMTKATPYATLPSLNKLPKMKLSGISVQALWCEISIVKNGVVLRYGFFTPAEVYTNSTSPDEGPQNLRRKADDNGTPQIWPSIYNISQGNVMNCIGIGTMSDIIDISVSEFCPYGYKVTNIDANYDGIALIGVDGNERIINSNTYNLCEYYWYGITDGAANSQLNIYNMKQNRTTLTLTPTDFERHNGRYVIRDSQKNPVMTIPGEMMESSMTIDAYTYSDTSGIYSFFRYKDIIGIIRGSKIAWATSQWETYKAYSMQYDRQALQNNIDIANKDMEMALIDSAANGIVGGVIGGAVAGGGVAGAAVGGVTGLSTFTSTAISANMKREQQIDKLRRDQELTEQRMRNQPGTSNNTTYGYGFVSMIRNFGGAELTLEMPEGLTETEWNTQTAAWGYPSNKVKQSAVVLTAGYWKGRVTAFTDTNNNTSSGELSNLMVEQFDNGLRLKQVS